MASSNENDTGFSQSDIHFARETFLRDCPNGYCTKRKFLAFLRNSSFYISPQKSSRSNLLIQTFVRRQNYRQIRKFFSMMFDIYDQNHDGKLDFDEYIYALSALSGASRLHTIETLYNFFDSNHQGYITRQEFNARKKLAAQFLGQYQAGINESYEQAFNAIDTNRDGRISKEEFIQWHLQDHIILDDSKPRKKRTRLLRNLTNLVDLRGQIKTSSLQQQQQHQEDNNNKNPINAWLETTTNVNHSFENPRLSSSSSINADRYFLKVLRQARDRFNQYKNSSHHGLTLHPPNSLDNQSDSGVFTTSSRTNFNDDIESNSLLDIDEDYLQSTHSNNSDDELLCQSLEAALMETLKELRQLRTNKDNDQPIITRL